MIAETAPAGIRHDLNQRIQGVIEAFRASGSQGEDERRLPPSVFDAMRSAEMFSLIAPREYGGAEVGLKTVMETIEALAREDGAMGWTYAILAGGPMLTAYLPPEGAREVFNGDANQPFPGSVIPAGKAIPVPGGYRVSGRWPLASGSRYGDWIGCTALILDDGVPRLGPSGAPDIHTMLLRREECRFFDTWQSVGLRGTGSIDFSADDVFVPETRVFSVFGASSQVQGPLYRAGPVVLFSMKLSSVFAGIASRALDEFVALAMNKTPTLSQTGLAVRSTIHAEVARAQAQVQSARAFLHAVADEVMDAVQSTGQVPESIEVRRRLACANTAAVCRQAVDTVFNLAGSTPVYSGNALERCLRDIHVASQHLLVSPVWWEKTGQYYFGQGLGMP